VIDHPAEGEVISGLHYAIRIGASDSGTLRYRSTAANGKAAEPRPVLVVRLGIFHPGVHKLTARLVNNSGENIKKTLVTKCIVK